jgi:xylose isomerase
MLMQNFFHQIAAIYYEGKDTQNPLAYRYYNPKKLVLGKSMAEHLRIAVSLWHPYFASEQIFAPEHPSTQPTWKKQVVDQAAHQKARFTAMFEFINKLGVPFFTFQDRDIAKEGLTINDSQRNIKVAAANIAEAMAYHEIDLLWGTANLSHLRYSKGAVTNPDLEIFTQAIAQVKDALDVTHQLSGQNYLVCGGCEGYESLLNTNLKQELNQYASFLKMLVDYKYKIGFKGNLLLEPKPFEHTKHQYDFNIATVLAFLQQHGLEKEFTINVAANHTTLAEHSFPHDVAYAYANNIFGSIDCVMGDGINGWDVEHYPQHLSEIVQILYMILQRDGFKNGGFNFDTMLRSANININDMFYAHIKNIDTLAQGLLIAASLIETGETENFLRKRYQNWDCALGRSILQGQTDFEKIFQHVGQKDVTLNISNIKK